MRLLNTDGLIPKKVIWICLTDPIHDELIISGVKNLVQKENDDLTMKVIQLRLNLIKHLVEMTPLSLKHDGAKTLSEKSSIFRRHIARCLRLTSFLLLSVTVPTETSDNNDFDESLINLTSEYLRLVCDILVSKIDLDQTSAMNNSDFLSIIGLFMSIIGSNQPLNHTLEVRTASDSFRVKDFNILVSSFQEHIDGYHTTITSQLLEYLSIFAARSGPNILRCMIDVHWNATFLSKYTNWSRHKIMVGNPFVLVKLLKSLPRSNSKEYITSTTEKCCSRQVITKLMMHRYNISQERHQHFVYSMRRHWGLLTLSRGRMNLITNFLHTLLGKLVIFFKGIDDCPVEQTFDSKSDKDISDDDDDDAEYLPPSSIVSVVHKPKIPTSCDFECLTSDSYPIYLDMLIRMTVASTALFSMPEEMVNFEELATTSNRLHPVYELERIAIIYGSLMKLYKDKFHIFPKSLLPSIMHVSKCMLDLSVTKSQEFIAWRNCQPVILAEEEDSGSVDLASTTFLKKLLDTFGVHVIGTLFAFCGLDSGSTSMEEEGLIHKQNNNQLFFGKSALPGLASLARKTERTFEFLSQTSKRYSTGKIKVDIMVQHTQEPKQVVLTKSLRLRHGKHSKNEDLSSTRKRSVGRYEISQSDEEQSFVGYSDESTSSGSDEFGVSGNWGQNVDGSDDEESDSEFCIDRFDKCN